MFARGLLSLHTPPLLGRNSPPLSTIIPTLARHSRKSNYSRTYKVPRGEGGVFHDPLATRPPPLVYPEQDQRAAISFVSPAYEILVRNSIISPPYAKTGEYTPLQNVGAPTFLIFLHIFRSFCGPAFVVADLHVGAFAMRRGRRTSLAPGTRRDVPIESFKLPKCGKTFVV